MDLRLLTVLAVICLYLGYCEGQIQPARIHQTYQGSDLKVSSFNIRIFGQDKMKDPRVVEILVKIIQRYDIIFIQEIRDIKGTAIHDFLNQVNSASPNSKFRLIVSIRLGKSVSQEQYAFFYRENKMSVRRTWQSKGDFERPPFAARFTTDAGSVWFLGIHTKPSEAPKEIDQLVDAYTQLVNFAGEEDILLGGDFNAGCRYVTSQDWRRIRLRTDKRFQWVVGDDTVTTVSSPGCPYDRFVLAGRNLQALYIKGTAGPFNFKEAYKLDQTMALKVSDHYPIEMRLHVPNSSKSSSCKSTETVIGFGIAAFYILFGLN